MTASLCAPSAARASTRTLRTTAYGRSGAPDMFVGTHPLDELFAFIRSTTWTREQIDRNLTQCGDRDALPLRRPLVHDRIAPANGHRIPDVHRVVAVPILA